MPENHKPGGILLHLCLLSALAVAQPLYNLIGQNPEFLVAHNITGLPVIGFVVLLSVVIPALLLSFYFAARWIHPALGSVFLYGLVATLVLIFFLPVAANLLNLDGVWAMLAATAGGVLVAALYFKAAVLRLFLSVFSFAALAFPLLFLFFTPASELLSGKAGKKDSTALTITADNPVFILVFDEFPTLSILDSGANVDPGRFPALAGLLQDAVWYRNHSANSNSTLIAIPALLSGNMPYGAQRGLPTDENFPDNIFALLGDAYSVHAVEHATRLCPHAVCGEQPNEFRLLLSDTSILLAHIIAPPAWAGALPAVNNDWKNFANTMEQEADPETIRGFQKTLNWATRVRDYYEFVDSIAAGPAQLYYFHAMLPHATWKHMPDGSVIVADETGGLLAARPNTGELPFKHMWHDDDVAMRVNRQRHILQTGLVDTLIGNFLERLKNLGIYDESLIVITSDHGVSFQPGSARRNVYQGNLVEISAVPLFIKYPGNYPAGTSDINSQAMDIIPTVLDVIGASGRENFDGISLADPAAVRPDVKVMREANKSAITTDAVEHLLLLQLAAAETAKIYGEHDYASLFRAGDRLGLAGRSVSEVATTGASGPGLEINNADLFQRINLSGGFLPLVVHGKLQYEGEHPEPVEIALSVNGTLQAVSSLLTIPGQENEFEVLLPPSAFVEGENVLEAWLVSETADGVVLQRTTTAGGAHYQLSEDTDGKPVLNIDGVAYAVEDDIIRGGARAAAGESDKLLLLSGWAADLENAIAAETVVIFIDNEFYSAFAPTRASNSVAKLFDEPGLDHCGYRIPLAISSPEQAASMDVRVFAISIDQRVSELSYPADVANWPFKKNPRQ